MTYINSDPARQHVAILVFFWVAQEQRGLATTWAHDFPEMLPACSTVQMNLLMLLREREHVRVELLRYAQNICILQYGTTPYLQIQSVWHCMQIVKDSHLCTLHAMLACAARFGQSHFGSSCSLCYAISLPQRWSSST
eukprot:SAG11_NODE_2434_length_3366_cov_9.631466_2_plen_138_part_00